MISGATTNTSTLYSRAAPVRCLPLYAASGELKIGDGLPVEDAIDESSGVVYCSVLDGVESGEDAYRVAIEVDALNDFCACGLICNTWLSDEGSASYIARTVDMPDSLR